MNEQQARVALMLLLLVLIGNEYFNNVIVLFYLALIELHVHKITQAFKIAEQWQTKLQEESKH